MGSVFMKLAKLESSDHEAPVDAIFFFEEAVDDLELGIRNRPVSSQSAFADNGKIRCNTRVSPHGICRASKGLSSCDRFPEDVQARANGIAQQHMVPRSNEGSACSRTS